MSKKNLPPLMQYDPLAWLNESHSAPDTLSDSLKQLFPQSSTDSESNPEIKPLPSLVPVITPTASPPDDSLIAPAPKSHPNFTTPAAHKVILQPSQTIQNIAPLYIELSMLLNEDHHTINIDAAAVRSCDTATLQLLVIFKHTLHKRQRQLVIDFPSDAFMDAVNLLGLANLLAVDKSIAGFF